MGEPILTRCMSDYCMFGSYVCICMPYSNITLHDSSVMQKSQLPHVLTLILFESTPIGSQCYSQIVCIVCVCVYA